MRFGRSLKDWKSQPQKTQLNDKSNFEINCFSLFSWSFFIVSMQSLVCFNIDFSLNHAIGGMQRDLKITTSENTVVWSLLFCERLRFFSFSKIDISSGEKQLLDRSSMDVCKHHVFQIKLEHLKKKTPSTNHYAW